MANRYNRPMISRARERALRKKQLMIGGGALAALLVIALVILILPKGGGTDRAIQAAANGGASGQSDARTVAEGVPLVPQAAVEPDLSEPSEDYGDDEAAEPVEATPEPTPTPEPPASGASGRAQTRPSPTAEGFLPVFHSAKTEEKIVAITVDDCYQAENLQQIVDTAMGVGGKLTIFPIGQNAMKERQAQILKYAWENGFELENHTFTHNGLYDCDDAALAAEVYKQQLALSYILGVEYQCHFLRPRGGDARGDHHIHAYAQQLGYYGIAHWSVSGSASNGKIAKGLAPGAIFLFHTTDKDLEKLLKFIPWVAEQGYQMVTLNEMFGYPANETRPLETPISEHQIPVLQNYQMIYVPLEKTAYSWQAYLLQQKLIELGYLTGKPDGVYGEGCETAVKAYQKDHGLAETGVADAELCRAIIEGGAA